MVTHDVKAPGRPKTRRPSRRDIDEAWFERHREDLLVVARAELVAHGRGVVVIESTDRGCEGEFTHRYVPAAAFISGNPQGLEEDWAAAIRTYDVTREAVCALVAGPDGPFTLFVVITAPRARH
jgi:hypothetical protein